MDCIVRFQNGSRSAIFSSIGGGFYLILEAGRTRYEGTFSKLFLFDRVVALDGGLVNVEKRKLSEDASAISVADDVMMEFFLRVQRSLS